MDRNPLGKARSLRAWTREEARRWQIRFDKDPAGGRLWLSQHPARLMQLTGWGVERHHMEGFNNYLLNPRSLWLAPRGSGKSTVAVYFAAWLGVADLHSQHPTDDSEAEYDRWLDRQALYELLFGTSSGRRIDSRNIRIALTSSSQPNAKRLLWQVKHILSLPIVSKCLNYRVHDDRRDRNKRWTEELADSGYRDTSLREATWTALGMGSKIAGGHYDVVFGDDWVTLDNARTKTQREHVSDFWKFTVKGTCEPWARVAIAGTRYHPKDWYGEIAEWAKGGSNKEGSWEVLRHPAIVYGKDGSRHSYWPAVFSLAKLDAIRNEIGSAAFNTQYQNETQVMEGDFFSRDWLEQMTEWKKVPDEIRRQAVTGMALDMAFKGGPEHDWSVFTLGHMNRPSQLFPHGRFHLERVRRGRWTMQELVLQAERLYLDAKHAGNTPGVFAIEAAPGSEFLIQALRESRVIPRGIIKPVPPRINKLARAEKARTLFEIGAVWFDPPTSENAMQIVIDELLSFTGERGGQDDCVDSLVWLIIVLSRGRSRALRVGIHGGP